MNIEIEVREKTARLRNRSVYAVCGNSDYHIDFDFDSEWNEYPVKTARFRYGADEYTDVVFTGSSCNMPVIEDAYCVEIGVYAGSLRTTTGVYLPMKKSIRSSGGTPSEPAEDVYDSIMELLNGFEANAEKVGDTAVISLKDSHGTTTAVVKDGTGIAHMAFKESSSDGNVYTMTLTDGTKYDITAPKGPGSGDVTEEELQEIADAVGDIKDYLGFAADDYIGLQADYENRIFKRLGAAEGKTAGADFDEYRMFGGRRRCNLANDGTINAYYGDAAYKEDGTNGQVMVYQPAFYYKVVPLKWEKNTAGLGYHLRKANYYLSDRPAVGFRLHPAFFDKNGNPVDYILFSAYEGSMWDASANKYVNDNVDVNIAYSSGDLLCSLAGKKPVSGLRTGMGTKANFEAMASGRGEGWHLETIKAMAANQLLMMIELGTMNTQAGIGRGIVSIADNTSYNCSSITGSTAALGSGTGSAASTVNEKGGVETTETASGKLAVAYRGVENPWGNIWKHVQGINAWGDGSMKGGQLYVCDNLTDFNESSHSGHYHPVGFTLANDYGYIKAMGYGNPEFDWLLMPSETGGDSSVPVGDYNYSTSNLNYYRITIFGDNWRFDEHAGGFCVAHNCNPTHHARDIGGRLMYVPMAK